RLEQSAVPDTHGCDARICGYVVCHQAAAGHPHRCDMGGVHFLIEAARRIGRFASEPVNGGSQWSAVGIDGDRSLSTAPTISSGRLTSWSCRWGWPTARGGTPCCRRQWRTIRHDNESIRGNLREKLRETQPVLDARAFAPDHHRMLGGSQRSRTINRVRCELL